MSVISIAPAKHYIKIDGSLLNSIVDLFYDKMLDDYAINRFFSVNPIDQQTKPLKKLLKSIFAGLNNPDQLTALIDDYFMAAFGKPGMQRTHIASDFDFLLEIAGGKDTRVLIFLSDAHSHLLKLKPDDFHYDVVIRHLTNTLKELAVAEDLQEEILTVAESARNKVLGRG